MFKFLKEKLRGVISSIKRKAEEEGKEEKTKVEEVKEDIKKRVEERVKKEVSEEKKKIFGFFRRREKKEEQPSLEKKPGEEKPKEEPKVEEFKIVERPKKEIKKEVEVIGKVGEQPFLEKSVGGKKEEIKVKQVIAPEVIKEKIKEEQPLVEQPFEKALTEKNVGEKVKKEIEKEEKKLGIFGKFKERVITKRITEDKFNELFEELELVLLENNVAFEVVEKLKEDLRKSLVDKPILRKEIGSVIGKSLRSSLREILTVENGIDLVEEIKKSDKPYVILLLGYNGSGKTLSCARLAYYLGKNKFKCLLAAGDTFRAAGAIQLEELAKKVHIPIIVGQTGADSCALIFDSIKSAKAKKSDVVIADTAGRIQTNRDLMRELEKIVRINKPNLKLLVIDALSGTDVVEQARQFDDAVGVDGFIITKVDAYEKGGAVLNASYITKKPIFFMGVGQLLSDLKEYSAEEVLANLGF